VNSDPANDNEKLRQQIQQLKAQVADLEHEVQKVRSWKYAILNALPHGIFWKDCDSVFRGGNQWFLDAVGLSRPSQLVGLTDYDMPYANNAPRYIEGDRETIRSGQPKLNFVERMQSTENGPSRWVEFNKYPLRDESDDIIGIMGTFLDVTQRQMDAVTRRRQHATIEAAVDAIAFVENDVIKYANPAWSRLFGYQRIDDLLHTSWHDCYPAQELDRVRTEIEPELEARGSWRGDVLAKRQDGTTFNQGMTLSKTEDGALICICRDVSELKSAQAEIERNALHDELTALPNRRLLIERLALAIKQLRRNPERTFAVLFIDLDRFKIVNDSLGHAAGDQLLIDVSQRLMKKRRATDLIARLGGDEFVVLLNEIDGPEKVARLTQQILDVLGQPTTIEGREIFSSASIGVVMSHERYTSPDEILRDADIAMYRAKRDAANSYKFFDEIMFHQVRERLTVETDLRQAIKAEQLDVHYQPIINLNTGQIEGCEALVRWCHPERGMVRPDLFVPIAEEAGLIDELDGWVMQTACRQLAKWQQDLPGAQAMKVNVNVSTCELRNDHLIDLVQDNLTHTGLRGESLCIELTERVLIDDFERTISVLSALADKRVRVSIDDFGTGYSSFSYLHKLPVNNLKIDRSFVSQMDASQNSYKVASIIISLSDQLGLNAVAEGIETPRQLQLLQTLGCEFGQGYFFSRPLPAAEFEALMRENACCIDLQQIKANAG
jgi:diguanylate cyclase (GGDEF)-like protein/PAS domain S-box-containing protein